MGRSGLPALLLFLDLAFDAAVVGELSEIRVDSYASQDRKSVGSLLNVIDRTDGNHQARQSTSVADHAIKVVPMLSTVLHF